MPAKNCAVIGSGLGGLSAAIRCARMGLKVDLYERNTATGGKAGTFSSGGFRFDTGPSLLTMPFVLEDLFSFAGKDISSYMTLLPLEETCRYFFHDGTRIRAHRDIDRFADEIEMNTEDTGESVREYLEYCARIYSLTAELFLFNDFHELSTFTDSTSSLKTLFSIHRIDPFRSVHRANSSFFRDPRTLQLFDRYTTYNGSDPYRAPATLNIIPHVEYSMGAFIVKEGVTRIPEALTDIAVESGVDLRLDTGVERIETIKDRVRGIRAHNSSFEYDMVITNADVHLTYRDLLKDTSSRPARKYRRLEPSSSAVIFYWGVSGSFPDLGIHNIMFSADYRREFNDIFALGECPEDPTVYIYISSRFKPDDAPAGYENWFVMINAPCNRGQDWQAGMEKARKGVTERINRTLGIKIEDSIVSEKVVTPPDIEAATSSHMGSIYGISSNSQSAAFLRQGTRSRRYPGLYFCGGSAHPGGGIPLVLLSGKIASGLLGRHEL